MGTDASWPLQNAVNDALSGHKLIGKFLANGTPSRQGESAEQGTELPRIALGDSVTRAWRSATFDGQEHEISVHVWTDEGGSGRSKEIASIIIDLLHDADLPLPGHALVDLQFESSETRQSLDNDQYHCLLAFKGLTVSD